MASSLGSETVHAIQKPWLIYRFQYLLYRQLHYFILVGYNSQRTQFSVGFGYIDPSRREWFVRFVLQPLNEVSNVAVKMLTVFFLGHFIYTNCFLAVKFLMAFFQQVSIDQMIQTCEFRFPTCR